MTREKNVLEKSLVIERNSLVCANTTLRKANENISLKNKDVETALDHF
jgi:hypothetical protein